MFSALASTSATWGSRCSRAPCSASSRSCGRSPSGRTSCSSLGAYMTLKDARDLVPSTRDSGAWQLGLHRRFAPLRAVRYADGLPSLAGAVAFAIGVVNLASALTPNIEWRGHVLLELLPVRSVPLFHSIAVPASVALIVASFYLRKRRKRAWAVTFALLVMLGVPRHPQGTGRRGGAAQLGRRGARSGGDADTFYVEHERAWKQPPLRVFAVAVAAGAALVAAPRVARVRTAGGADDRPSTRRSTCSRGRTARPHTRTSSGCFPSSSTSSWRWRSSPAAGCSSGRAGRRRFRRTRPRGRPRSSSCARTEATRSRSSSCGRTCTISSRATIVRSSATGSRTGCSSSRATRSARPTRCRG